MSKPIANAWYGITNYDDLQAENEALRDQVEHQKGAEIEAQTAITEYQRAAEAQPADSVQQLSRASIAQVHR